MESGDGKLSPLDKAREAVDSLYAYRDHYFEKNSIDNAAQKEKDVAFQLEKTLRVLESLQVFHSVSQKAEMLMLQGKTLNVLSRYDHAAQEALEKAVKLDPRLVEAWVQLGEVYWKNRQVEDAKNCFTGALSHGKNKVALRNLSMVLRQLGKDEKERSLFIEESVERAKEAVQLDLQDGTSWCIFGNAYLSLFFASTQNPKLLKQCMSAYQQAERDSVASCNPDLHFNRATVFKYEEDFASCLAGFAKAAALDPTWPEPKQKEQQCVNYLGRVNDLVKAKGKLKAKRLSSLVGALCASDLGPYSGGSYTSPTGKVVKLDHMPLSDLKESVNRETVVVGKVVCSVTTEDPVPFTFCMVDKASTCVAVTVYNIAAGYGVKIGDSVAIPEPYLQTIDVTYKDQTYRYPSIRVESPLILAVNSRKLTVDKQAPTQLAISTVSD